MLNLSIMPLDIKHVDEICEDIAEQQRSGVSTHAMFQMKFNPEGTPAVDKATEQCKKYDVFRERLDRMGAKHGVLVQATLGHISVPSSPYPFQPSVFLSTGEERVVTCCPLDPSFREYIKEQFRTLATRHPSVVMIDDDVGLLYKQSNGCACKYHMAEFNRRAGTNMSREELYRHAQGKTEENKHYQQIYVEVIRDSLVDCVKAMRAGLDAVDPTIQGVVSGIYTSSFCEFSGDIAKAFSGKGNPAVVRLNGGPYAKVHGGARFFTSNMFRAAILRENVKDKVDIFLAETDTCPQNRYSTSAALLHSHFTASIFEGATGAKHWLTRLGAYEPASGRAYRKKLAKYSKFYEALCGYVKELSPFGCRIPLTLMQNYAFVPSAAGMFLSPWASCFIERIGLPLYFANKGEGAVFVDDFSVDGFSDTEIKEFLRGTLILSVGAAEKLVKRGFADSLGVTVSDWNGDVISGELVGEVGMAAQYGKKALIPISDKTEALSIVVHTDTLTGNKIPLFPGVTRLDNPEGGETLVFCGTPDMPYAYATAFSLLNETRKKQIVDILKRRAGLPIYYPGDVEMYMRAGRLPSGEYMVAMFNISQDALEEITLVSDRTPKSVEMLNENGEREACDFEFSDGDLTISRGLMPMTPMVLFIS